jgi:hypothetical protein
MKSQAVLASVLLAVCAAAGSAERIVVSGLLKEHGLSFSRTVSPGERWPVGNTERVSYIARVEIVPAAEAGLPHGDPAETLVEVAHSHSITWGIIGSLNVRQCDNEGCVMAFEAVWSDKPRKHRIGPRGGGATVLERIVRTTPVAINLDDDWFPWCVPRAVSIGSAQLLLGVCRSEPGIQSTRR